MDQHQMRRRVPGRKKIGMKPFTQIPTLEELAAQPELAQTLSADATRKLWLQCVSVLNALSVPLTMNGHTAPPQPKADTLLSVKELAILINRSKSWCEKHPQDLPLRVSVGGSPMWRLSDVETWMKNLKKYGKPS